MIERTVLLKLNDDWAPRRAEVAAHSERVLKDLDHVLSLWVGMPADTRTQEAWDVCLIVGLAQLDDIEPYVMDPRHREYVDDYLKPKTSAIKAWNFERA